MAWNCYLTTFRAKSPIHIGYRQIEILKTTRYYITGRAMWGAITANLTRALFENPSPEDYRVVGNFVRKNIRTTYFYPAIKNTDIENPEEWSEIGVKDYLVFLPNYINGLKFGKILKEEFEQIFIGSFVSTALESTTKAAEEGSLHEFEFIRDKVKIGESIADVYWVGYLFIKEDELEGIRIESCNEGDVAISMGTTKRHLRDTIAQLYVGGERNYGLGKVELVELQPENNLLFGKYNILLDKENPTICLDDAPIIDHMILNGSETIKYGEIEPVVGLEWSDKGAGQEVSKAKICATPGSILPKMCLQIVDYGFLNF